VVIAPSQKMADFIYRPSSYP